MRVIVKGSTRRECIRRIEHMQGRGWSPLHEPKEVVEIKNIYWVCVMHREDKGKRIVRRCKDCGGLSAA